MQGGENQCLPSVSEATARSPVQLEGAVGVWNELATQSNGFVGSLGGSKVNEAVASIAAMLLLAMS